MPGANHGYIANRSPGSVLMHQLFSLALFSPRTPHDIGCHGSFGFFWLGQLLRRFWFDVLDSSEEYWSGISLLSLGLSDVFS
jgi:hypothetical protein